MAIEAQETQVPAGDPFAGENQPPESAPEPEAQPAPTPNGAEPEPAPAEPAKPDEATEQHELIAQKAAEQAARQALEQANAPEPRTLADVLARQQTQPQEPDPYADPYAEPQYADPYGQQDPYAPSPDPYAPQEPQPPDPAQPLTRAEAQQLFQGQQMLASYLVEQEHEALLEKYSDLDTAEGQDEVERRLGGLQARGVDVQHPAVLEQVFEASRAALASEGQGAEPVPPDQARNQGATLETNAGAAVDGAPSEEDQWWGQVKRAQGSAFGD